jgi:hypothetical protein
MGPGSHVTCGSRWSDLSPINGSCSSSTCRVTALRHHDRNTPVGYARALAELLDELELETVDVAGNSVGGGPRSSSQRWDGRDQSSRSHRRASGRSATRSGPGGSYGRSTRRLASSSRRYHWCFAPRSGARFSCADRSETRGGSLLRRQSASPSAFRRARGFAITCLPCDAQGDRDQHDPARVEARAMAGDTVLR